MEENLALRVPDGLEVTVLWLSGICRGTRTIHPMYSNHRPIVPALTRFNELFEALKSEFDAVVKEMNLLKMQKEECEQKIQIQINEMALVQDTIKELEKTHLAVKKRYEDEIGRLKHDQVSDAPELSPVIHELLGDLPREPPVLDGGHVPQTSCRDALGSKRYKVDGLNLMDEPEDWNVKREGADWTLMCDSRVQTGTDMDLAHSLDHGSVVCAVAFSHNGELLATGSNKQTRVYEALTGILLFSLMDGTARDDLYIRAVAFSPDSQHLAVGAEDRRIRIWDLDTRTVIHTLCGHEQDIYSLQYSIQGTRLVSGSGDRTIKLWDPQQGSLVSTLDLDGGEKKDGVTAVAFSPDGVYLAAGSLDRTIRIWTTASCEQIQELKGHQDSVYSVCFSLNGQQLVSGSLDRTIRVWEFSPETIKCVAVLNGHKDYVLSVVICPTTGLVVSGSKDRSVRFWDLTCPSSARLVLQGHKNSVISVAANPCLPLLVTGSGDGHARIWKYKVPE